MIKSILDNDLYKFTMQQAVHMLYPRAEVEYRFVNRGDTPFPDGFAGRYEKAIEKLSVLILTPDEEEYLKKTCYFMTPVYLDFLRTYRFDPKEVQVQQEGGRIELTIKGPWFRTILWEVPLMATMSELYFKLGPESAQHREALQKRNREKSLLLKENGVSYADFGTRRRYSLENHERVLQDLLSVTDNTLVGTSNVYLAKKFDIRPIGTHAHEWFMYHAVENGYRLANRSAIEAWTHVYHGHLGIALTDTFTTDAFLSTFDSVQARLFDGVRHDSGDPFEFVDKVVTHYKKMRIEPNHKTIVFSDALNPKNAVEIKKYCRGKINASFGLGTNLTNDVGPQPLNIVIKMTACRSSADLPWHPTVKLSDAKEKNSGDPEEIALCERMLRSLLG